ncbi:S1C family serine protease [Ancylomarina sp. 16SWW S1-10-2]|uniref:S1C family serine protease n=1 Tax=Ancylomarina sp. 16SWW S1-10-2 TaxID=2499681 RepID=UPI0012AD7A90|nr:trypsin-like peptidase domain-containing protein [Ancylomarina sp. 16SWW S1-10-2]MRT93213.1 trypsin-like serine protease [Ancylomarina sp. 16SWW S1-10-2]
MNIIKVKLLILSLLFAYSAKALENIDGDNLNEEKIVNIQKQTKLIYPHILECTVSIGEGCSGVIVSEDGYVLTASHVIQNFMQTGEKLSVKLQDGVEREVERLGRSMIGDFALLKLKEDRKWPYVKIGSSESLSSNEVCLMLGHSGGYLEDRPAVLRSGFVRGYTATGFLRTTCTMMPGDSGGPLFNLNGELIGINSYCWEKEYENYFSPTDRIMKDWDRIKNGEEFNLTNPAYYNKTITKAKVKKGPFVLQMSNDAISKLIKEKSQIDEAVVYPIYSLDDDDELIIHATQIASDGIIVSKSSMIIEDAVRCKRKNGTFVKANVIGRSEENDLVFLKSDSLAEIQLTVSSEREIGDFIGVVDAENNVYQSGVIGVDTRNVPVQVSGMFGMEVDGLSVSKVYDNSNSFVAGIKAGDQILGINSMVFNTEDEYKSFMENTCPNQVVDVRLKRGSEDFETRVKLGPYENKHHPAYMVELSGKKEGFAKAFTFDIAIKPIDCGTPLINVRGEIVGVTIARSTRTCAFAIPIEVILEEYSQIVN